MRHPTVWWVTSLIAFLVSPPAVHASQDQAERPRGAIHGRVLDPERLAVPGIEVRLEGRDLTEPRHSVTAADGTFRFEGLPTPGTYVLRNAMLGIFRSTEETVRLTEGASVEVDLVLTLGLSEDIVVTDTREASLKRETAATVERMDRDTIDRIKPTHPGEVMNLIPGVWVNTTSGEGHAAAIRQPLTTDPVYLYLEDGVPTRSPGFFNHNALYEVNVPAAEGIEVTKGPGSALQGSDAIGGVINVLSRSALGPSTVLADLEAGGAGWLRALGGGNISSGTDGVRLDLNVTRTDGWRDATGYERYGGTLRWDRATPGTSSWKTLASFNAIEQQTAGSSRLPERDYFDNPTWNLTPISYRDVTAARLSTDYERIAGGTSWSVIPFFRYNAMALMPNWTLTFDPTEYETRNTSFGVLAKVRREWPAMRSEVVAGFDFDLSPGSRLEKQIAPSRTPTGTGSTIFSAYTAGPVVYDYDVTFLETSPYAQFQFSPSARVRVSLGARFDRMQYDYADRLEGEDTPRYRRPEDASLTYTHFSPKAGVTVQLSDALNVFAGYRNAFRVPSEGQLFRQGSTRDTIGLKPVNAHNMETGVRLQLTRRVSFESSLYRLDKRDDIISYRDPNDGFTHVLNAGRTLHRGIEVGGAVSAASWAEISANYSYARHTYSDWVLDPREGLGGDYSGREMEMAPRHMGNLLLTFWPERRAGGSLDVSHLGWYWLDAENTQQYGGHTLVNLRARLEVRKGIEVFARVLNLTDRLYAEAGAYTRQRGREFAPGMPRTAYIGVRVEWEP
jgi:outer membrane receptor protein involved in Fe transport